MLLNIPYSICEFRINIISNMLCHSIDASHHCQVYSIGCSVHQNECLQHYHTADSVLTSGCSFISQHIWIKMWILLGILGRCIEKKRFSRGQRSMWIGISGQQMDDLGMFTSRSGTVWGGWCSGWPLWRLWSRLCSQLSASVGQRCTGSFPSPACLWILCGAILARKASGRVVLMKYNRVSFYPSLHLCMPRKLNTVLLPFSDLSTWFLNQLLCFFHYSRRKPSFGHFGHIQGEAYVGLSQLYTTSLHCHRSRQVEYLQQISSCFKQWDAAITSTIYTTIASSKVTKAWFLYSGDDYQEIRAPQSQSIQQHDISFRGLWGYMPWSTMEVSSDGHQ